MTDSCLKLLEMKEKWLERFDIAGNGLKQHERAGNGQTGEMTENGWQFLEMARKCLETVVNGWE